METVKSDVTIIGGGIIGLCIAYSLAKKKLKVTVVEKDVRPKHASWAAAGVLSPIHFERYPETFLSSCFDSLRLYPPVCDEIERETLIDAGLKRCGMNILVSGTKSGTNTTNLIKILSKRQVNHEIVKGAEIKKKYRFLSDSISKLIFLPDTSQIRNDLFIKGMEKLLIMKNVRFIRERITNYKIARKNLRSVSSRRYRFISGHYVLSAGPWSSDLLAETGVKVAIEPVKGYIVQAGTDRYAFSEILICNEKYVVPRSNGYYLLGSTLDRSGFDTSIQLGKISDILDGIKSYIPDVVNWDFKRVWTGLRPKIRGRNVPVIDFHPKYRNFVIATGHYRNGILLAPLTGVIVTSKILKDDINSSYEEVFRF